MPLARIITDHPEAASTTIRALRDSGYIIEVISTGSRPDHRADLVLRADENGLCRPDIHRLQAANVYFADSQTSAVEAPFDSEYEGPYEREFVLAPAWRSFKAKLAELKSHFVSEKPEPEAEEFIRPTMLNLDAPVERRRTPPPPAVAAPVEEEYVPPAYLQREFEALEPPVYQDIAAPVHFESMMPMAPQYRVQEAATEPVVEALPEPLFQPNEVKPLGAPISEPVYEPQIEQPVFASQEVPVAEPVAEPSGPSRLQEELTAFKQHARGLAVSAIAEGKQWWAHRAVAAGDVRDYVRSHFRDHARDLVWKRSFAMAAALTVAFLFGFNAASQRETTPILDPNLDRNDSQMSAPAATPVVPAVDRSNLAAGGIQKASLVTTPALAKPAAKQTSKPRRAAVRDWEEDVYDEDEDVERYGDDVIVRHYPTKKVVTTAKNRQRGTRKISDMD